MHIGMQIKGDDLVPYRATPAVSPQPLMSTNGHLYHAHRCPRSNAAMHARNAMQRTATDISDTISA